MTQSLTLVVLLVAACSICEVSYASVMARPPYIQCQSNSECALGNCCTIGQMKFSIPTCKPMEDIGGVCRPGRTETINTTLLYPDGSQVELTDVHVQFCPCGYGLTCNAQEGLCRDASQEPNFNNLSEEAYSHRDD